LAEKYGGDLRVVRVAALLHDITKELSLPQQLNLCEKWSIIHDYDNDNIEAVIHADTAAEVARHEFGFGESVCSAVKKHTVGASEMSIEDKIVFVADACEETRTYPEAEKVRQLAFENLDEAIIYIVKRTAERLEKKGIKPYYMSQKVLEAFCKDRERS
jgi:nicotinate-nucleotide adenylyltransferase